MGSWVLGKGIPDFIDALNNGLMSIDYSKINDALKDLWKALTPFAINVGEGLLWFWKNVLVPLGTWTANEVLPRFLKTLSEVIKTLNSILEALQPLFQWFWDNVLTPIVSWTAGAFLDIWDSINDTLSKFSDWCSKNPETIQNATVIVGSFFAVWETMKLMSFIQQSGGVVAAFGRIKKATLEAVAAKLLDKAETIYLTALYAKDFVVGLAQTIAGLVKQAASFAAATAAKVADTAAQVALTAATALWNATCTLATAATTALGVAVNFLTSPIGLVVLAIGGLVAAGVLLYKNWDTVSAKAKSLWVSVKKSFNGLKGSVEEIFNGIWNTVKNVVNSVLGGIESMVNGVLRGVNSISNALNNMSFEIPDWVPVVGGGTFGFNLPTFYPVSLPRLAQGGFVKANTPQLAVIGDNRHEGEVVAPESKLQAMVDAAVAASSGKGITKEELTAIINDAVLRIVSALAQLGFYVDSEELARAVQKGQNRLDRRQNPSISFI